MDRVKIGRRVFLGALLMASCGRSDAFVGADGGTSGWTSGASFTSGGSSGGVGETGSRPRPDAGVSDPCEDAAELRFADVLMTPEEPPGWNPGESLLVDIVVVPTDDGYTGDGGVHVQSNTFGVSPKSAFIGQGQHLPAGQEVHYLFGSEADPTVEPGTVATFTATIRVTHPGKPTWYDCPELHLIQFEAVVE